MSSGTAIWQIQLVSNRFSWPVMALIAVYWFRTPLTELLGKFKRGKMPGFELEMQDRPQQAGSTSTETVEKPLVANTNFAIATSPTVGSPPPTPLPSSNLLTKVMHTIQHSPEIEALKGDAREELMARAFADKLIALSFERIYRNIFGSQIEALVIANNPGGTQVETLKQLFETAKQRFANVHAERTFDQWLGYLKGEGLVEEVLNPNGSPLVRATDGGKEFLRYMVDQGLQPKLG